MGEEHLRLDVGVIDFEQEPSIVISQEMWVFSGYLIGGGDLKGDMEKMEAIMKWSIPTNVYKVMIFVWETKYL